MVLHSVAELQTRSLVDSYGVDSLRWGVGKAYMVHFVWMAELKFEIFTIDIRVWKELPEGTTNSIWIRCDHLKSIVSVSAIRWNRLVRSAKSRLCADFVEIVCRISPGTLKSRSCVDFAEIVCRFRQVFIGVRLRFEKSSRRWRIVRSCLLYTSPSPRDS